MAIVTLIEAQPSIAATGAAATVRLAGGGSRGYAHLGSTDWRAGLVSEPRFRAEIGFDQDGPTGAAMPASTTLRFAPADSMLAAQLASYYWIGAPITIRSGDDEATVPTFDVVMVGTVAAIEAIAGVIILTVQDSTGDLSKPVLSARFAGDGGIEGGSDAADRIKRQSYGRVFNVEGRILDKANNIYEFGDPTIPLQAFDALMDKGREGAMTVLAWQGSIAATLAALIAAVCPQGGGVVAPSIACAKWWTQPGVLTANLRGAVGAGYVETAPAIAGRIVAAGSTLAIANIAAMVALRGAAAGIHFSDTSETIAMALDRLLLPISVVWAVEPAGAIRLRELTFAAPVESLASLRVARRQMLKPTRRRRIGYKRNHRTHGDGEISAILFPSIITLSRPSVTVPADAAGVVSSFAGAAGQITVKTADGFDVTSQCTFTKQAQANCTGAVTAGGAYSVSALSADTGTLTIRVSYGGQSTDHDFVVTKAIGGGAGAAGLNNATVFIYRRAASAPTLPSAATTYTFATAALTGLNNSWTTTIPAGSNPLYVSAATASASAATDTIAAGEWAVPVIMAQDGAGGGNGLNAATVYLYQRNNTGTAPAAPTTPLTYTFATGLLSGTLGAWTQSVPAAAGGKHLFVTTATALATGTTDTIASAEWATVNRMAADGADGQSAPPAMSIAVYSLNLAAEYGGAIKTGQLPRTVQATMRNGVTDVSSTTSWSVTPSGSITASIATSGLITVTAAAGSGWVDVTGTFGGVTETQRLSIAVIADAAPPAAATSLSISVPSPANSNSFTASPHNVLTLAASGAGQLKAILALAYDIPIPSSGTRSWTGQAKIVFRAVGGGAWTDFSGGAVNGSAAFSFGGTTSEAETGFLSLNQTQTGLSAGALYEVGWMLRRLNAGDWSGSVSTSGSMTVRQP